MLTQIFLPDEIMRIDEQALIRVLVENDKIPPLAKEEAANLADYWIKTHFATDISRRIVAVECGFQVWLDQDTLIVGMQDCIFQDAVSFFGGEWKTKKAPRFKLNGEPYKGDTEDDWLADISTGPQLAIYAIAQHAGIFYEAGNPHPLRLGVPVPRIMVRAAVKSNPPLMWPTTNSGIFEFSPEYLDAIETGLISCAAQIRAARRGQDVVPWQLPGKQCHSWGRDCQFLGTEEHPGCLQHSFPIGKEIEVFNPNYPAFEGSLKFCDPKSLENPNLVVLSASSYQLFFECAEKFRRITGHGGEKDESGALAVGTAFHLLMAEYYRQIKAAQK